MAAAPPPCSTPAAWVGLGPALPPQPPPVRRRHARELRAPRGHGGGPPAGSGGVAAGGRVRVPLAPQALEDVDPAGQARRRPASRRDSGGRDAQQVPVGRLDQRLHVGHDRELLSWNRGASAGCRAAAARLRGRRSGPPGTGSGTGSGGSTRSPWPPKPPKAPRAEPQPPVPNGPMVVITPATPPSATSWKSPCRPRPSPVGSS